MKKSLEQSLAYKTIINCDNSILDLYILFYGSQGTIFSIIISPVL